MEFWRNEAEQQRFLKWVERYSLKEEWSVVKNTDLTYLVRGDDLFAKAVTMISEGEAKLSHVLTERFPQYVPEVIAVHPRRRWFIMKAIKGGALREAPSHERYVAALRTYAHIQQDMSDAVSTLFKMGIPDRRPSVLKHEIRRYLPEMCQGLDKEKAEAIFSLEEELLAMCEELETGVPMTVEHGDLHAGNIFWQTSTDAPCILDWGDATVTHPFFSVRVFWNTLFDLLPYDDDQLWMRKIEEMRTVYLAEWAHVAPPDVLERHIRIAEELGCVYRAISWHAYVTDKRRDKQDSSNKPAQWLNLLLEFRAIKHAFE